MPTSTFSALMSDQLRADFARPLVTFYDDATGERIELSVTTYANWVNKTAGLVQDELDIERGALLLVDLPTHWLGAVWLGAAWTVGLCVTTDRSLADKADLVVCGPDRVEALADAAEGSPVVAISLRPLGGRFVNALPDGVTDYGAVVLAQPDVFVPYDAASGADPAFREGQATWTQDELVQVAIDDALVDERGRLLTDANPCSRRGLSALLSPLLRGGGTVWVANADPEGWSKRYDDERATAQLRAQPPRS